MTRFKASSWSWSMGNAPSCAEIILFHGKSAFLSLRNSEHARSSMHNACNVSVSKRIERREVRLLNVYLTANTNRSPIDAAVRLSDVAHSEKFRAERARFYRD